MDLRLPRKEDRITYGLYLLVALVIVLAALSGCAKKPITEPVVQPVVSGATGTTWELPVEQVKEKDLPVDAGKDRGDLIGTFIIPPRPDGKPTRLNVYDKPKTLKQKAKEAITGDKGSPPLSAISDNPGTQAKTAKHTGLWPYLTVILAVIGGFIAARKWLQRFAWVKKVLSVIKKFIPWP